MDLTTPVTTAGRAYKAYAKRLERLGITTLGDFLYHFPFRYDDFSLVSPINQVQPGDIVTIQGKVVAIKNEFTRSGKVLQKALITDNTGEIEATWFNQPFLTKYIQKDTIVSLSGKVEFFIKKLTLQSPEYELLTSNNVTIHTGRLVPIYPETHGVSSKWLRRQIYTLLQKNKQNLLEYIPDSILKKHDFITIMNAIEQIHFPKSTNHALKARTRLSFDEFFILQSKSMQRKKEWNENLTGHAFSIEKYRKKIEKLVNSLPFTLTHGQKNAIEDIFKDITSNKPMNRLLEGDVGSGKTVVSAIAMYAAFLNGYQSVLMAPTEILANQHYQTIKTFFEPIGVRIGLATGSNKHYKSSKPDTTNSKLLATDILVGTHAVLSKTIQFKKLGLVVIDEQQRFGVHQRTIIRKKGVNPHLLTMTATPIPRTVALTMFGDLDLSILSEMPKGRKTIRTWLVPAEKREPAYTWIEKQIKETHSQVFLICPFIEESESMQTVKAATVEFERLQKHVFRSLRLGLLHGKLKAKEKDEILKKFREKAFDILVATPVVEVGIDIPNATIMVIEAAERFGLSQLHQLRGRVGRGEKQSYCLLFSEAKNEQTLQRLKAMETRYIGAELAELDLSLRGPGELYGTMQHGIPQLKIARFSDFAMIEKAKKEAEAIFPHIQDFPLLLEKIKDIPEKEVSPD